MTLETRISAHYSGDGLLRRIVKALAEMGVSSANATSQDLKPVDEFHVGGISATTALIDQLGIMPDLRVLDIGCGIGGTARFVAESAGAHVTGVDVTSEYTSTAAGLSELVGMAEKTDFHTASALAMPFDDNSFDAALMLHVGMNIPDKAALMTEAARVLRSGSLFAIFDIMKVGVEPISFPVPWASGADSSFLEDLETYREAATKARFVEVSSQDKTAIALEFFADQKRRAGADGPRAIGLHILMGADFSTKVANLADNIVNRRIAPVELIVRLE